MGTVCGFQLLKSPITETLLAFGAQTANCTPRWPSLSVEVSAELFVGAVMRAFREQVEVEFAQRRLQLSHSLVLIRYSLVKTELVATFLRI